MSSYIVGLPKDGTKFENGSSVALAGPMSAEEAADSVRKIVNEDQDALPFGQVLVFSGSVARISPDLREIVIGSTSYALRSPTEQGYSEEFVSLTSKKGK